MVVDPNKDSEAGGSLKTEPSDEELHEEYTINFTNGKKNLVCGDFPEAVACFQVACSVQSERFGDTAPECAEVFFYYGKALLELARQENEVLGTALKAVPDADDSDSDDETAPEDNFPGVAKILREATDRFLSSGHFSKPKTSSRKLFDITEAVSSSSEVDQAGSSKTKEKNQESDLKNKPSSTSQAGEVSSSTNGVKQEPAAGSSNDDCLPSTSTGERGGGGPDQEEEDVEENPDDVPNMQLAWEMLELAKVLFTKKPSSDDNTLMIGQCCLKLGELGLEIENYPQAIGDFSTGLALYKSILPKHDRRLAESHYSIALAYSFNKDYEKAIEHYQAALSVLESRIEHLSQALNSDKNKDSSKEDQKEIDEIKELIPDIKLKIEDVVSVKIQESRIGTMPQSSGFSTSSNQTPVCSVIPVHKKVATPSNQANDISHLIRRKRANNYESNGDKSEVESKKLKADVEDCFAKHSNEENIKPDEDATKSETVVEKSGSDEVDVKS